MPKVYNKRHGDAPPDAVYVGRPSKWGNPYHMYGEADRKAVVDQYRGLLGMPNGLGAQLRAEAMELRGKDLVCWCAPLLCHADVLLEIANAPGELQ